MNKKNLIQAITEGIQEKKGKKIVVADMSHIVGAICQHFVICQGSSPIQVEAIADSIAECTRKEAGEKPVKVIGQGNAQWIAMDYTDVMVHIFLPDVREYYDLEHLWDDATLTQIPDID